MRNKGPIITETILTKNNKIGGLSILNLKTKKIRGMYSCNEDRQIGQQRDQKWSQ